MPQALWKEVGEHTMLLLGYGDGTVEFRLLPDLSSIITLKSHIKARHYLDYISFKKKFCLNAKYSFRTVYYYLLLYLKITFY